MHLYFKNNLTLNTSGRSNQGHFEVKVKIGEAKTIEKNVIFFSHQDKNSKHNHNFGLKTSA